MIWTEYLCRANLIQLGIENNPLFAWDNYAATATLSGSPVAANGQRENAVDGSTSSRWRPDGVGSADISALIPADTPVQFLAIAAHSLHTAGASVQWHYNLSSAGGAWVPLTDAVPAVQGAMAWRFRPVVARQWRLTVTGIVLPGVATLGVLYVGRETVMPMRIYQGFVPRIVAGNVELQSNVSEGGNLIGSSVVRSGSSMGMNFANITPVFVRGEFKPFMEHFNRGSGFFTAWRPEKYPEDVYFGWRDGGVIRPENAGPKDYMSLSVSARLHDG